MERNALKHANDPVVHAWSVTQVKKWVVSRVTHEGDVAIKVTGKGVDLHVPTSLERFYVVQAAQRIGVARIGLGATFVHIGVGKDVPQNLIWLYAPDR